MAFSAMFAITLLGLAETTPAREDEVNRSSDAELATVSATVSSSAVQVAEPFTLELMVNATSGTRILLPAVGPQLGEFDVVEHQDINDIPSKNSAKERTWTRRITLESIITGDLQIPAMEIQVVNGSDSRIVKSDAIPIRVNSVLEDRADPTQFRDIQSVVDVRVPPQSSYDWVWWTAGGLGILTLGSAAIAAVVRRRKWLTPQVWAREKLESLRVSQAMQEGDSERVSLDLSSILRSYLDLQFEISAPTQTTDELLQMIRSQRLLDPATAARFGQAFQTADLTKFAGLQLSTDELSDAIDEARELVVQTASEVESRTKTPATTEAN